MCAITTLLVSGFLVEQNSWSAEAKFTNPALTGMERINVLIVPPYGNLNDGTKLWEELRFKVIQKLKESDRRFEDIIYRGGRAPSIDIPELRIAVELLKLNNSRQFVYRIQTSLSLSLYIDRNPKVAIKTDVWTIAETMEPASIQVSEEAITDTVLGQAGIFAFAYKAANPQIKENDQGNSNENQKEKIADKTIAKEEAKTASNTYKYVSSKSSKVFHLPQCKSASRILPENMVGYATKDEAVNANKRPCKSCNP